MIVFSPDYPHAFLPQGAPRIAMIDDRARRGWRLICQLITEAGGEVVVIPRTVSEYFMNRSGVKSDVIKVFDARCDKTVAQEHQAFLDGMRAKHLTEVRKILESVHAVILPGNEFDVPPSAYGESEIHKETKLTHLSDFRFDTECVVARHALDNGLPILGICGGFQLLVALTGGRLIQHLPDTLQHTKNIHTNCLKHVAEELLQWMECDYAEFLDNPYKACPVKVNHPVSVTAEDSRLAFIAKKHFGDVAISENPDLGVFSIHHQGAKPEHINTQQMRVTALAPDGIVEAIEHVSHPFCVATQFHPEFDVKGIALPLVKELIAQCRK